MKEPSNTEYGVIVSDQHYYSVWPTRREPPPGWSFTKHTGTCAEMQDLVRQDFVATTRSVSIGPQSMLHETT